MATFHRRGSALITTVIFLMVMFTLGSALLSLTTSALARSEKDMLRSQALDVAEAGVEKAIYYLRNTAPDGTNNGTWRTGGRTETLSGAGDYTFSATDGSGDDAGKIVILCTGTATTEKRTVSRRLRVIITRTEENIAPWNNVVFGGVGQTGRSINGNVVMRGNVHLLGEGEPYDMTVGSLDHPDDIGPMKSQVGIESECRWFRDLASVPRHRTLPTTDGSDPVAGRSNQHPDRDTDVWPPNHPSTA